MTTVNPLQPGKPPKPGKPLQVSVANRVDPAAIVRALGGLSLPAVVTDLPTLWSNADSLVRRANGLPIRIASKSVRCREVLRATLDRPGYQGILAFQLAEALWLHSQGFTDLVVGYPTADRRAIAQLAANEQAASDITLMVDSAEQLDLIDSVVSPARRPIIRLCLDVDASFRLFRLHIGVRRSPVHHVRAAVALARLIRDRAGFALVGLMSYEAQIAGISDAGHSLKQAVVRELQRRSIAELADRRASVVAAVREVAATAGGAPLEFVNGGGTGSLESSSAETSLTEVAAGSGLYGCGLFDHYTRFKPAPALYFALPVVRRPAADIATVLGGGWVASGPAGQDRLPVPTYPAGLKMLKTEGAGEVQTPLRGRAARNLRIGDVVLFRHAKAGEMLEHTNMVHLVDSGKIVESVPSYRGEGKAFL